MTRKVGRPRKAVRDKKVPMLVHVHPSVRRALHRQATRRKSSLSGVAEELLWWALKVDGEAMAKDPKPTDVLNVEMAKLSTAAGMVVLVIEQLPESPEKGALLRLAIEIGKATEAMYAALGDIRRTIAKL